jgi:uncharacterized protein YndB with AHSA1/START domain
LSPAGAIEIRRRLPAPITEVFRWWTDPQLIQRWMTPVGTVEAEVDLRVGGSFRVVMKGEGRILEHVGEYTVVEEPRRLVFTWSSPHTGPRPSLVTVELEQDGQNATHLRLVHSELPASAAESHGAGWSEMLDRLQETMPAHLEPRGPLTGG